MPVSTFTWQSAQTNASDAEFRKWGKGISDALAACGLVKTSDTGQVNWATVTVPATSAYVYEIWRFNDAAQATKPLFIKVEYGTGTVSGRVNLRLSASSGSDGAGTLSGSIYLQPSTFGSNPTASSTEYPSYASGDGSSVNIILWPATSTTNSMGGFTISRSCGTSGAYTTGAAVFIGHGAQPFFNVVGMGGSDPSVDCAKSPVAPVVFPYNVNGGLFSATASLSQDGTTAPVIPIPCIAPGVAPFVMNCAAAVSPGDAGATSVIQVATINGSTRTYRAFPYAIAGPTGTGSIPVLSSNSALWGRVLPAIAWAV